MMGIKRALALGFSCCLPITQQAEAYGMAYIGQKYTQAK